MRDYILQNVEEESVSKRNRLSRPNHLGTNSSAISVTDVFALVKQYDKDFSSKAANPLLLSKNSEIKSPRKKRTVTLSVGEEAEFRANYTRAEVFSKSNIYRIIDKFVGKGELTAKTTAELDFSGFAKAKPFCFFRV